MNATGILGVAVGHPYYGMLAFNLAVTLKANGCTYPFALAYTESALRMLSDAQRAIFDILIPAPPEMYTDAQTGKRDFSKTKMYLYELSPFADGTLFLDVDTAICPGRNVNDLIQKLSSWSYNCQNYAFADLKTGACIKTGYTFWMQLKAIAQKWNLPEGRIPQQSTTIIWFRKTAKIEKLFALAKQLNIEDVDYSGTQFIQPGFKPDELYFNVACAKLRVMPDLKWQPVHFEFLAENGNQYHKVLGREIPAKFWAITNGGDRVTAHIAQLYNTWTQMAASKLKLSAFKHYNKRDYRTAAIFKNISKNDI